MRLQVADGTDWSLAITIYFICACRADETGRKDKKVSLPSHGGTCIAVREKQFLDPKKSSQGGDRAARVKRVSLLRQDLRRSFSTAAKIKCDLSANSASGPFTSSESVLRSASPYGPHDG